jgi:tol-pal system protein YbgF
MKLNISFSIRAVALAAGMCMSSMTHAGLLEDDEARRAILELRQKVDQQGEEIKQFQNGLLNQQNEFEALRSEMARLRGEKEELMQQLRQQQQQTQVVDERLKKFEPSPVTVDGVEFVADPVETKAYEDALAVFRKGDFKGASTVFSDFTRRYPKSGYVVPSLFWLGNAQYANRDYKEAIRNFNALIAKAPNHMRAADSLMSVASCQLELKDLKAARATLDDVIKKYPNTEAASAAKERLSKLK